MFEKDEIIEINGIKMEVDLREAKKVERYRIGDNVKILIKENSYDSVFSSYPGVIVGFDGFKERPTIIIAYLKVTYNEAQVKFLFFNKDSKDVEICPMIGEDVVINKTTALELLDKNIAQKQQELFDLQSKRNYFLSNFGKYFKENKK